MRDNPVQFAVVREDPDVEASLVERGRARQVLLVASGGCTALSLQARFPELAITLLDVNPAQLAHVRRKVEALRATRDDAVERRRLFNVGVDDASGLNACGNFESLFRGLRDFLREYVAAAGEIARLFGESTGLARVDDVLIGHRYWPVAFELFFADPLLRTMFGAEAVQHAPPGSYPAHFRRAFERGLRAEGAARNYFLHHVLLGRYVDDAERLPPYLMLALPEHHRFTERLGKVADVAREDDLSRYEVVSLSNLFDWMPDDEVRATCRALAARMSPGAVLVYRQLNHLSEFERWLDPAFEPDERLARELLERERSLFYSKLYVGVRR